MDIQKIVYKLERFPIGVTVDNALLKFSSNLSLKKHRDQLILNFLKEHFSEDLVEISVKQKEIIHKNVKIIWTMWLQGETEAPDIVKLCFKKMRENLPKGARLIILDEKNIAQYIDLPQFIIDKFKAGSISPAHYSDIIRAGLLAKYGGCGWIVLSIPIKKYRVIYLKKNLSLSRVMG